MNLQGRTKPENAERSKWSSSILLRLAFYEKKRLTRGQLIDANIQGEIFRM